MRCDVQIYMVLGQFHVYKSVLLGWIVGRFNIAINGEHNCGVPPLVGNIKNNIWNDVFFQNFILITNSMPQN